MKKAIAVSLIFWSMFLVVGATLYRNSSIDFFGTDYGLTPSNQPAVGDVLTVGPSGSGTVWGRLTNCVRVWSGTSGGIVVPVGSPVFMPPNNSAATLPTSDIAGATRCPVTRQTILQNLYVVVSLSPGAGKTNTLAVTTNGVASSLSATVAGTATNGSDTTHNVTVPAGTEIGVRVTTAPGSVSGKVSWSFEGR